MTTEFTLHRIHPFYIRIAVHILYLLGFMLAISVVTFGFYGWDKHQASVRGWRVPEKTLHTLSLFGGWPGAIAGQQFFRHKTQKKSFRVVFYLTLVLNVAAVIWLMFNATEAMKLFSGS